MPNCGINFDDILMGLLMYKLLDKKTIFEVGFISDGVMRYKTNVKKT